MKITARFLPFIFLGLFSFLSFCTPAFAQTYSNTNILNSYTMPNTAPDVPQNTHTLSQSIVYDVLSATSCQLSGIDPTAPDHKCLAPDANGQLSYSTGNLGLIGTMTHLIAFTYTIPVNTHSYIAYMQNKFGVQKTYAAGNTGVGFQGLTPLLSIWAIFRNIVYLLFIIVFILLGLGIMLRIQLDPRTVMTIENQLPKILIGLILVTFSYAIAGLLIDLMWILTFFSINTLSAADVKIGGDSCVQISAGNNNTTARCLSQVATNKVLQNPIGYFNDVEKNGFLGMAGGGAHEIQSIIWNEFSNGKISDNLNTQQTDCNAFCQFGTMVHNGLSNVPVLGGVSNFVGNASDSVNNLMDGNISTLISAILGGLISWVVGVIAFFVIVIALLIAMFRVWFMLLRAYIYVLVLVILAPFFIVFGLIPGSAISFGSWFRNMAANLLAFPAAVFVFVLSRVLYDNFTCNANATSGITCNTGTSGLNMFVPPLIGNPAGTSATDNPLGAFIALGLIFVLPEILNLVNGIFGNKGVGIGAAIGGGFGAGTRLIRGGTSTIASGAVDPTTGRFGGFRIGRVLSRL